MAFPIPSLKRVAGEDYPDAPEWFRRFLDTINPFLGDTVQGFSSSQSAKQVETFRLDTTGNVSDAFANGAVKLKNKLQTKPASVRAAQIFNRTAGAQGEDTAHAPTFSNSWTNFGSGWLSASYMKDSLGFVHLEGAIKSGTSGLTAFTLPSGYRPTATIQFATASNAALGLLSVGSNGDVIPTGSTTHFALNGVSFRADASTSPAPVEWTYLQNGLISITYIQGLAPNRSYDITLIVE